MDQDRLRDYLEEASDVNCFPLRRKAIQTMLRNALIAGQDTGVEGDEEATEGITSTLSVFFNKLFLELQLNRPQDFIKFFPVFAMLCGDRKEGEPFAEIDWSLVPFMVPRPKRYVADQL